MTTATKSRKAASKKLTTAEAAKVLHTSPKMVRRTMRSLNLGTGGTRYEITTAQLKKLKEAI